MRGLAALWVFLFHVKDLFTVSSPLLSSLAAHGHLGVPMFFVISGYVIACSADALIEKGKSPLAFLKNRFLRIYPAFWASVAVVLLAPYLINLISALKSGVFVAPTNIIAKMSGFEWTNFLLLTKVFFATSHDLQAQFNTVNSVYWSLAVEFQFYLVVFIALFCGRFYKRILGGVTILSVLVMISPEGINFGLFIHYWPAFAIGLGLSYLLRNPVFNSLTNTTLLSGVGLTILALSVLVQTFPELLQHDLAFPVCFGLFLVAASRVEPMLVRMKESQHTLVRYAIKPWLALGMVSYSVYLLHGRIYILPNMFVSQVFQSSNILFGLLTVLGTLLLCAGSTIWSSAGS
jgi:peptidoglycan/LPS O-acetylase OafA/YrhL